MAPTLPLVDGGTTLESALAVNDDVLLELSYPEKQAPFCAHLLQHPLDIEALAAHHLGLGKMHNRCHTGEVEEWMRGNFNVNIPVHVEAS